MGYVLWGHRGSGDHGCEDYLRGLCTLLPKKPQVLSHCPREDWRYDICSLASVYRPDGFRLKPGDWCFQTRPADVKNLRRQGIRPVLFYCAASIPSAKQLSLLHGYEAVAVTERRSLKFLQDAGIKNVTLCPDPAFLVRRHIRALGGAFRQDTVGLCLSYPPEAGELLLQNYRHLIRYILDRTNLQIALIPYCVKPRCNDMLLHRVLFRQFKDSGRICLREDGDVRQLRGDISLCRFCVGCAGAVAAWSCGVPALCLCANGRTLGMAQTLFSSCQAGVVPWQLLKREEDLTHCFHELICREDNYRHCLERNSYKLILTTD